MKFYLGTHMPDWPQAVNIPWFISVSRVINRVKPVMGLDWIMDSGGFTQIGSYGEYTISEQDYINSIDRHSPNFAFCQDWMCEPHVLQKTGLTVFRHQELTLKSYILLSKYRPIVIRPVLQGWTAKQFSQHVRMYRDAGVDMSQLFGVGTVCSRNNDDMAIYRILKAIHDTCPGIRLHGFGLKTTSLHNGNVVSMLESADSMAWSSRGRRTKICTWGCPRKHCGNCLEFALLWRKRVLSGINRTQRQCALPLRG